MTCAKCRHENVKKFGVYGRKRTQRYRCNDCGATFSPERPARFGNHLVDFENVVRVTSLLLEGMSVRAASRITGMHKTTILALLILAGRKCQNLLDARVRNVRTKYVQLDELWTFVHTKERHLKSGNPSEWGDTYTWVALDAQTKLVISHLVGKRDAKSANEFIADYSARVAGIHQVTSDGFKPYIDAIETYFGADINFAQLVKVYGKPDKPDRTGTAPARLSRRSQPQSAATLTKPISAQAMWSGPI
jgi:transposase-like protein/IS1 family transposase